MTKTILGWMGLGWLAVSGCSQEVSSADEALPQDKDPAVQSQQQDLSLRWPKPPGWILQLGGTDPILNTVQGRTIAAGPAGSTYIAASYQGNVSIAGQNIAPQPCSPNCPGGQPGTDILVGQVDKQGNLLWSKTFGSADNDWVYDLVADKDNNLYITGSFATPISFGQTRLTSRGNVDVFVAKLDSQGNPLWATSFGGAQYDHPERLALSPNGSLYVIGSSRGTIASGSVQAEGYGGWDAFIGRIDPDSGQLGWLSTGGGPGDDRAFALATDGHGALYVTGAYSQSASFFGSSEVLQSSGGSDIFLVKLSPNESVRWTLGAGGQGDDAAGAIAVDPLGFPVVVGSFEDQIDFGPVSLHSEGSHDIFVTRLSPHGKVLWSRSGGGPGDDRAGSVAFDPLGWIYVLGRFEQTAWFGYNTGNSRGGSDIFIAQLDWAGHYWALRTAGGPGPDAAKGLLARALGHVTLSATFSNQAQFGANLLTSQGNTDGAFWDFWY